MGFLLIEDDTTLANGIALLLRSEGFSVYTTNFGEEGIDLGKLCDYELILLDLDLPDMSGYEVLRELRRSNIQTPILIISGLADVQNRVQGLAFGADDYLTKPVHKDELVARVRAVLRRSAGHAHAAVRCGDLVIKLDQQRAEIAGRDTGLTTKEYMILELLAQRQGSAITKEMLLNHLYGGMDEPGQKIIDVFICKLRQKLADSSGGKNYIETIWGRGYVLRDPQPIKIAS
jgi:two-component system cell cycle response regulator CtrA